MKKDYFLLAVLLGLWKDVPECVQRIRVEIDKLTVSWKTDWSSAIKLAEFQSVTGLLFSGMSQMGVVNENEKYALYNHIGPLIMNNSLINHTLLAVITELNRNALPYCLLKGQGIGAYYNEPEIRVGGDIDLYVGKYQQRAIESLQPLTNQKKCEINGKHANLCIYGIEVELHKYVDSMISHKHNEIFWKWSEKELFDNAKSVIVNKKEVRIPKPTFNAFCIFYHLFRHFLISGVGLRQLFDWARLLYCEKDNIDREELCSKLQLFGIDEGWDAFMTLLECYLFLPECATIYCKGRCSGKKVNRIMKYILMDGNMGVGFAKGIKPKGTVAVKWYNMKRIIRRSAMTFSLFPRIVCKRLTNYLFAFKYPHKHIDL